VDTRYPVVWWIREVTKCPKAPEFVEMAMGLALWLALTEVWLLGSGSAVGGEQAVYHSIIAAMASAKPLPIWATILAEPM
jgi:hypothetical protein